MAPLEANRHEHRESLPGERQALVVDAGARKLIQFDEY